MSLTLSRIGEDVLEQAFFLIKRGPDFIRYDHGAQGAVAAAQAFGNRNHIRCGMPVLHGEVFACPSHARDHFIGDKQDIVRVADLSDDRMSSRPEKSTVSSSRSLCETPLVGYPRCKTFQALTYLPHIRYGIGAPDKK